MNIVITGGLGYIGTELCNIFSGESRFNKITVIDKRFVSERVKQLRDWNIDFVHGDILDNTLLERYIPEANIVIHLAGITDVAYVKSEENNQKDDITNVGQNGTLNILKYLNDTAKIIFPSTHVVYEGFQEVRENLKEEETPCPILTYSTNKRQSELDIINSKKNYIILRLGSVYGYSGDTMRIGIMPNLFSKISSQNGTIRLFGGGIQLKSLVNIKDVARCFKFFQENDISNQIYHLSNENTTVEKVAILCKKINPKIEILKTNDEIPNLGYTISNEKLKSTGFKFLYDLENSLKEMFQNWSKKELKTSLEWIDKGGNEYIDDRGIIRNYELTEPINLIGYIESKKGTVRANHYHPIQEQKCLLIKGKYISVIKDLVNNDSIIETRIINPGDVAVIKPNVIHTMVFLEDSIFLNLVRGEREHENYGITHTIPFELVNEKFRVEILKNYRTNCRVCNSEDLELFLPLGKIPLANNLIENESQEYEKYPLELLKCNDCSNCQLSFSIDHKILFDNYLYTSSTSKTFRDHFEKAADNYIELLNLKKNDLIVDIGSNDGIGLARFSELGYKVLGIEPAKNICEIANKKGIRSKNSYFDEKCVDEIKSEFDSPKLVLASNVFAHNDNLFEFAKNVKNLIDDDGTFIIEVQYLVNTLQDLTFDNIYHEHYNYWSVTALNNLFKQIDLKIAKVEKIDTHGGSIRVYINKNGHTLDNSLDELLKDELKFGINNHKVYTGFSKKVENLKFNVQSNLKNLKNKYGKIAGYGAPAKATTKLNYYNINSEVLEFIVEDNPLKINKIVPGVNIPIKNKTELIKENIKVVIVLAWNFFGPIKEANQDLIDRGITFVSIRELEETAI